MRWQKKVESISIWDEIASDMRAGTEIKSWFSAMLCRDDAVHAQLAASCLLDGPF
jgi:hypothetical protein